MRGVTRTSVLVLGAGMTGAGAALELARRGHEVTLVEQDPVAFGRASLRNEGKIHLGFIYANDPTRETAYRQLDGALCLRRTLARWLPGLATALVTANPFWYLVADDSVLDADALARHYDALAERATRRLEASPATDYLGERPRHWYRRLEAAELAGRFPAAGIRAGFATVETAVDTVPLANAVRGALARADGLALRTGHQVREVERTAGGFAVGGDGPDGPWRIEAPQVVNATWERRCALDAMLGLAPPPGLLHRLKYRVIAAIPAVLRDSPSVSMVLGRYGDVVIRRDGTAFMSWYPVGLQGWSPELEPPRAWDAPCRGTPDPTEARAIATRIVAAIGEWYPGLGGAFVREVDAGAIVAIGRTDVDDSASGLHDRTRIGVTS